MIGTPVALFLQLSAVLLQFFLHKDCGRRQNNNRAVQWLSHWFQEGRGAFVRWSFNNATRVRSVFRVTEICLVAILVVSALWVGDAFAQKAAKKEKTAKGKDSTPPAATPSETRVPPSDNGASLAVPPDHPLAPVIETARRSRSALKNVRDYTATFAKRELLGGRIKTQTMEMKLRHQPFSVYFHFRAGPEAGREVLYVDGANRGQLLVHEDGVKALAGTLSFPPTHQQVMSENRYPITKVGISHMLETVISQWEQETKYGEVEVKFYPDATLEGGKVPCLAFETSHPQKRREFKFHLTRMYFDKQSYLPLRVEQYDWPSGSAKEPPLVEEYTYSNLRTNVGLTDADFDRRNREYRF